MHKRIKIFTLSFIMGLSLCLCNQGEVQPMACVRKKPVVETSTSIDSVAVTEQMISSANSIDILPVVEETISDTNTNVVTMGGMSYSEDEINLIALVTMAEAEGECEEGKRLVIDTILNRVDSGHFPNTVSEVIYQPNQFTSMWNGRANRCYVKDDIYQLVVEEIYSRTNYDVVFFTAGKYGKYGKHLFQVGNHYFCSYD